MRHHFAHNMAMLLIAFRCLVSTSVQSYLYSQCEWQAWISDPRQEALRQDQADWTWARSGFFLRWTRSQNHPRQVTMLCFETSSLLQQRQRSLSSAAVLESSLIDPLSLFVIVVNDLSRQMDIAVWDISSIFGNIESVSVPAEASVVRCSYLSKPCRRH